MIEIDVTNAGPVTAEVAKLMAYESPGLPPEMLQEIRDHPTTVIYVDSEGRTQELVI